MAHEYVLCISIDLSRADEHTHSSVLERRAHLQRYLLGGEWLYCDVSTTSKSGSPGFASIKRYAFPLLVLTSAITHLRVIETS